MIIKDYTGRKVKDVAVLQKLPPDSHGKARYLCRCICGTECIKTATQLGKALRWGGSCNCGCKRSDRYRQSMPVFNRRGEK